MRNKVTVPTILTRKSGPPITMVTAYDAPSAHIVNRAGADIILVGDSVTTTVLGYDNTLQATIDMMVYHTAAVTRTQPNSLVIADMPWLSYHLSIEEAVRNAGRLIREGHADAVKLEGGIKRIPMIKALLEAEIPVMGHLGLTPQSVNIMGGHRVQGKSVDTAQMLIADARAIADTGVFAIVLEGIPETVASLITHELSIPTVGIGAGPQCDGQVLVFHDLLGLLFTDHQPKFVRRYANLAELATQAIQRYCQDVQSGAFPADSETYHMNEQARQELSRSQEQPVED